MIVFPSTPTNGQIYTDPNGISWRFDGVKWDVYTASGYKAFSGAKLTLNAPHVVTTEMVPMDFDVEVIDTDQYFNTNVPTRLTITDSGYYRVNLGVYSGSNGASYDIVLKKNGTSNLAHSIIAPNQYTNYDEVVPLYAGDYLEVHVSEDTSTGAVLETTFFEIIKMGAFLGTAIASPESFSGVRGILSAPFVTTTTPTAVSWSNTAFNQNANAAGALYWVAGQPTRLTVGVNGFYRLKGVVVAGSNDTYTLALKKSGITISTIAVDPNGYAQIDETYNFLNNEYIELFVNDTTSTGNITSSSYLELIRIGV